MKKVYSSRAIMPIETWRNGMEGSRIINPSTGRPVAGAGGRVVPPGGTAQQMRPGGPGGPPPRQPGGPPPGGAMPPPPGGPVQGAGEASPDQIEQMFKAYQQTKMQALFNDINQVIANHQCDYAITVGALGILQHVYAQRATSPPQQQPMGPPPPEMSATGHHTPAPDSRKDPADEPVRPENPNPEMSAGATNTQPGDKEEPKGEEGPEAA